MWIGGVLLTCGIIYLAFQTEITEYLSAKDRIYWSDDVIVAFEDFQDEVPSNSDYNMWYFHGLYLVSTDVDDARVRAFFDKTKSWVKDTTEFDYQTEMELQYIRFDLYEVHARKFNAEIDQYRAKGGKKFSDLEAIGDRLYAELNTLEDRLFDPTISDQQKVAIWKPRVDSMFRRHPKL